MRRAEEMRSVFGRFEQSGLTLKAFGMREGISYTTLQYWRRKLRDGAREKDASSGKTELAAWSPVRVVPETPPRRDASSFEVWLANGVSFNVQPGFDDGELRRLVAVLSAC